MSLSEIHVPAAKSNVINTYYMYSLDAANLSFDNINLPNLPIHSAAYINGTHDLKAAGPMTNGQLLVGSTGADPVATTITAGSNIVITNAAGSITAALVANPGFGTISINSGSQMSTYVQNIAWTPAITIGGSTAGITYSTQTGNYSKIGRMVYLSGAITVTSTGGLTGTVLLDGFPFAAKTSNEIIPCSWTTFTFDTLKGPILIVESIANASPVPFTMAQLNSDGTRTACSQACFSAGTSAIKFSGSYEATS